MKRKLILLRILVTIAVLFLFSIGISGILWASNRINNIKQDSCHINNCTIIPNVCKTSTSISHDCYNIEYNFTLEYDNNQYNFKQIKTKSFEKHEAEAFCQNKMNSPDFTCYFYPSDILYTITEEKSNLYGFQIFVIIVSSIYLIAIVIFFICLLVSYLIKNDTEQLNTVEMSQAETHHEVQLE